ncbi:MAG: BatA domain-containing protein [Ekhidna sp.]
MSFLTPFFLIGLGALLVPIIIHMWSKDAKESVAFGSLRFLRETETRTTRSIMPSQWLLLVLRLLILTLIVFLLADMQLASDQGKASRMYLVDQSYKDSELVQQLMDTVEEGVEVRWLANDFPHIVDQPSSASNTDYWNLLSNLPTASAECLIVISPLHQRAFVGKRKNLSSICQWIKPPDKVKTNQLAALSKSSNSYALTASYDEWSTDYELVNANGGEPIEISYYLQVDEPYRKLGQVFRAALAAIQNVSMVTVKRVESMEQADWVIWLSDVPVATPERIIVVDNRVFGMKQLGKYLRVNGSLSSEEAIQMELPRKLLNVFVDNHFAGEIDERLTMDLKAFAYKKDEAGTLNETEDASSFLWIVLITILLLERWLSFKSSAASV